MRRCQAGPCSSMVRRINGRGGILRDGTPVSIHDATWATARPLPYLADSKKPTRASVLSISFKIRSRFAALGPGVRVEGIKIPLRLYGMPDVQANRRPTNRLPIERQV